MDLYGLLLYRTCVMRACVRMDYACAVWIIIYACVPGGDGMRGYMGLWYRRRDGMGFDMGYVWVYI